MYRAVTEGANEPHIYAYGIKCSHYSVKLVSKANVKFAYLRLGGVMIRPVCKTAKQLFGGY